MENLTLPFEIDSFVKEVLYFESKQTDKEHNIPFYADGFAGIVFSNSQNPFTILPQNKVLPDFYLYGQTITPMTLKTRGVFEVYAMRLYPFVVRILLQVDASQLNDDCYDLLNVERVDTMRYVVELREAHDKGQVVKILSSYFDALLKNAALNPDQRVVLATNLILKSNGTIRIGEIRDRLHISERTLERQFLKATGVTALQFAKIIQFQSSIQLLSEKDYIRLSDIGHKSGYSDQSHFIRSFKKYTGKTPKEFSQSLGL